MHHPCRYKASGFSPVKSIKNLLIVPLASERLKAASKKQDGKRCSYPDGDIHGGRPEKNNNDHTARINGEAC
jgi:hypothetical protein